ncbi:VOC family protein [Micromonospora zamorensis]|uniref:VOC family protein n=1 Tax=Micromonospora zamorensis TaxID=709883 RepID=UPI0038660A67|nr:VOC family protein [Micromonospora zamorensis]
MTYQFHHITLRVSDLGQSRRFYEGILGLRVDQDFPGEKLRFRLGGTSTSLVLHPALPGTPSGDRFTEARIGLDHIAIGVPVGEVARVAEVLTANQVPNSGVKADSKGPAMVVFRDPDNIQWELFEEL